MDNPSRMSFGESVGCLREPFQQSPQINFAAVNLLAERFTFDVLHGDEAQTSGFADLVDVRDVRVVERGCRPRLLPEAPYPALVSGEGSGQQFEGNRATEPRVGRQVHFAHASGAEQPDDPVMMYGLPRR